MLTVVYPGTFDPFTRGHEDLVRRAARLFDRVVVGIAASETKRPMFTLDERIAMTREVLADVPNAAVTGFSSLLMAFVHEQGARAVLRGLRAVSDFEYEFQMAGMNHRLNPAVETVFLMASESNQFIASRFVKEIGRLGGDITHFVSPRVAERVRVQFDHSERGINSDTDPSRPTIPVPDIKQPL